MNKSVNFSGIFVIKQIFFYRLIFSGQQKSIKVIDKSLRTTNILTQ